MQPPLQRKTRLAGRIDRLGLSLLILTACVLWFYAVFGRALPALAAGTALALLALRTIQLGENRTLLRREAALRRRIGGEMAVDALLVMSGRDAAANAASWLAQALPLTDFAAKARGMLAAHEGRRVWIACLQRHASTPASCDDVLGCVRDARREGADICVAASTSGFAADAIRLAEALSPRTRLLGRDGLIEMAGSAAPATDAQLSSLGRGGRAPRRDLILARVLDPGKKRRYALYGVGLTVMYLASRQPVYLVPGFVCLALCALCRRKKKTKFTL